MGVGGGWPAYLEGVRGVWVESSFLRTSISHTLRLLLLSVLRSVCFAQDRSRRRLTKCLLYRSRILTEVVINQLQSFSKQSDLYFVPYFVQPLILQIQSCEEIKQASNLAGK